MVSDISRRSPRSLSPVNGGFPYVSGQPTPYNIEGTNNLFGDGHVAWLNATREELDDLQNNTNKAGRTSNLDRTYYLRDRR